MSAFAIGRDLTKKWKIKAIRTLKNIKNIGTAQSLDVKDGEMQ